VIRTGTCEESPETVPVIGTTSLLGSEVPDEKVICARPFASVSADDALICPPPALNATVIPSITALLASRTVAVMIELSELSDFTAMGFAESLIDFQPMLSRSQHLAVCCL
jgi:hypothetical protein